MQQVTLIKIKTADSASRDKMSNPKYNYLDIAVWHST